MKTIMFALGLFSLVACGTQSNSSNTASSGKEPAGVEISKAEVIRIENSQMFPVSQIDVYYRLPCNSKFSLLQQRDAYPVLYVSVLVEKTADFCFHHLPPFTEEKISFEVSTFDGPIAVLADPL